VECAVGYRDLKWTEVGCTAGGLKQQTGSRSPHGRRVGCWGGRDVTIGLWGPPAWGRAALCPQGMDLELSGPPPGFEEGSSGPDAEHLWRCGKTWTGATVEGCLFPLSGYGKRRFLLSEVLFGRHA
jgi:hypothetical protein